MKKTPKIKPVRKRKNYTWKNPPLKAVITTPHRKGCIEPFSGVISRSYFGNWKGQEGKAARHHLWIETPCNSLGCPAKKAVHSSILVTIPVSPTKKKKNP